MHAIRHILSWGLIASLLIGQTGISLHQIYCYCKGEWEARLFEAPDLTCDAHEQEEAHTLPSCCAHNSACNPGDSSISHLPCKKDQTIYLQLDQPAIPAKEVNENGFAQWAAALTVSLPPLPSIIPAQPAYAPESPLRAPPFRVNGRAIQTWVQSFRC